jgi:hypothetical protein
MIRLLSLLAALAALLVCAGPAHADTYDDNPATASRGGGDVWIFARATDGAIYERHWTGSAWTDWWSLGGTATSGPAAVGYGRQILVFMRGGDGAIYQKTLTDSKWSEWVSLGGYATSAPAATVRRGSEGYVDIAVKGGDNAIHLRTYQPGVGWHAWGSLGGNLTSAPALSSQSAGVLNVFARGTDGAVYQRGWSGSAWSDWINLGGGIIGAPATVARTENVVNVYARGAGNTVYQRGWTATTGWSAWFQLDKIPVGSTPAAGGGGALHEWLIARSGSGLLYKEWNGSAWTGWNTLGAVALPPPPPPAPAPVPPQDGEVGLETGLRCTPPGGRARVRIKVRKPRSGKKARVRKIVFFTKGKGRAIRVDRKAPWVVRIRVNRPAGKTGRVYARVYYKRSANGKLHRKTVSRRYKVCR